jgi:hypothetical protein
VSTGKNAQFFFILVATVALLSGGCIHHETRVYPAAEQSSLATRLEAARAMTFMNERDQALGAVARDAARAGDVDVTKSALKSMTFMNAKDDAAADCAYALSEAGQPAAAVEVARTMTFMHRRDQVLKKLATGN